MKSITHKSVTWHHFEENDQKTVKYLDEKFDFHPLDIEDVESGPQQPKTDFYKNYLFAVLHFPNYNKEEKRIHVFELDVFVGDDYVITVAKGENHRLLDIYDQMTNDGEFKEEIMGKSAGFFFYKIIDELTDSCWPVVRRISTQMSDIEDEIYSEDTSTGTVWRIALTRRNLIRLRRILNPQIVVMASLVHADKSYLK